MDSKKEIFVPFSFLLKSRFSFAWKFLHGEGFQQCQIIKCLQTSSIKCTPVGINPKSVCRHLNTDLWLLLSPMLKRNCGGCKPITTWTLMNTMQWTHYVDRCSSIVRRLIRPCVAFNSDMEFHFNEYTAFLGRDMEIVLQIVLPMESVRMLPISLERKDAVVQ